jgi:endonuclease/exonuclease/phosphatase (EEP) superfamily protein YafD
MAQRMVDLGGPVIVMGDFNLGDQTKAYTSLSRVLDDAYREAGWGFGFTFPYRLRMGRTMVPGPLVCLNYVFYSDHFYAEQARVVCSGASDHCHLVAQLAIVDMDD